MMLNIILGILAVIFLITTIYFILQVRKLNGQLNEVKNSNVGTLILSDRESFYLELNDENSVEKIYKSQYVVFNVKKDIKTLN